MKLLSRFSLAAFVFAGLTATSFAQDAKKEKLVDFKDFKVTVQKTPDFALKGGTTDKRVKPKDWLEFEPEIKILKPADAKKAEVISELTFKYYVYLDGQVKDNARILTGEIVHTNLPIDELTHSVVYVSPSTILRVTGKPEGDKNMVKFYGVEVTKGSELVGFFSSSKTKFWEAKGANVPPQEAALMTKAQTPFAPLWGDYHADVKAK